MPREVVFLTCRLILCLLEKPLQEAFICTQTQSYKQGWTNDGAAHHLPTKIQGISPTQKLIIVPLCSNLGCCAYSPESGMTGHHSSFTILLQLKELSHFIQHLGTDCKPVSFLSRGKGHPLFYRKWGSRKLSLGTHRYHKHEQAWILLLSVQAQ